MKTKHTPGQWTVGKRNKSTVVSDKPHIGMTFFNTGSPNEVEYYGGYLICESICSRADAKLIAAAPDLLEALLKWKVFCDVGENPTDEDIRKMDLAIKKATL